MGILVGIAVIFYVLIGFCYTLASAESQMLGTRRIHNFLDKILLLESGR